MVSYHKNQAEGRNTIIEFGNIESNCETLTKYKIDRD